MTQGAASAAAKGKAAAADGNGGLGFDVAFKAQVDAASRDYILEPRLGELRARKRERERDKRHRHCFEMGE